MFKTLTICLLTLSMTYGYGQDMQGSNYLNAGINLSNIRNYSYINSPSDTTASFPIGFYFSFMHDVALCKNGNCNFYFTYGFDFEARKFHYTSTYDWSPDPGYMHSSYYTRSEDVTTTFYILAAPLLIKQKFSKGNGFFNVGFIPYFIDDESKGQYVDSGFSFNGSGYVYENTPKSVSGTNPSTSSFGIDAKFSVGYFFGKHIGSEIGMQIGLTDIYKEIHSYYNGYGANFLGGRFTVYSLGLVYRLYKDSNTTTK